jgi:hypothetical protein
VAAVDGLLDVQDAAMRGEPGKDLLRALIHEVPTEMRKDDDWTIDGHAAPSW